MSKTHVSLAAAVDAQVTVSQLLLIESYGKREKHSHNITTQAYCVVLWISPGSPSCEISLILGIYHQVDRLSAVNGLVTTDSTKCLELKE